MQKSKTYCIFAAQYFPHLGGVERYTYNLAKQLIQDGNKVIIVTSNVYHLKNHELVNGIPVYRIPCYNLLEGRYPVIKFNKEFWRIHRKLKSKKIDMVIVNTRFYLHSLYGMLFARQKKWRNVLLWIMGQAICRCIIDSGIRSVKSLNMHLPRLTICSVRSIMGCRKLAINGWDIFISRQKECYIIL